MANWKLHFLHQACLGRETNLGDPRSIIFSCVKLAYRDMLSAGRFYVTSDMNENCQRFIALLEKHHYQPSPGLIDDTLAIFGEQERIGANNRYATRFGLAQKLVNMTFKYLYIFSDLLPYRIDFGRCDCPLDSIILSKLPAIDKVWSKLDLPTYNACQCHIRSWLDNHPLDEELQSLGNLAFDFISW